MAASLVFAGVIAGEFNMTLGQCEADRKGPGMESELTAVEFGVNINPILNYID